MPEAVVRAASRIMSRQWCWRDAFCAAAACDVFRELHGFDPMAEVRGSFATERGALRWVRARGGMTLAVGGVLEPQGFAACGAVPGALGLVPQPGPFGAVLAICIRPGAWAAKTETGLAVASEYEVAWKWGC